MIDEEETTNFQRQLEFNTHSMAKIPPAAPQQQNKRQPLKAPGKSEDVRPSSIVAECLFL